MTAGGSTPVLMCGMFDMRNFGDLMFPLVAQHRLGHLGYQIAPVSPTGADTGLSDALPSIGMAKLLTDPPSGAAGMMIGGGYMIHAHRLDVLREYREADCGAWAGPSLWLGSSLMAALLDLPIVWNAPGVPHPLFQRQRLLARHAVCAADYYSLRDTGSARILDSLDHAPDAIVPDPISDIAALWPCAGLRPEFEQVAQRQALPRPDNVMAVHVRRRSLGTTPPEVFAQRLDDLAARLGLSPLLIGIGSSHGDDVFARRIAGHMTHAPTVLDDPQSLREIAAVIAHSRLYLGSSLHGYVAAAAYDVPGILVGKPAYQKFRGYLDHTGRMSDLATSWDAAFEMATARAPRGAAQTIPAHVFAALDAHWARMASALTTGPEPGRAARLAFAAQAIASGTLESGVGWAMQPFVDPAETLAARAATDTKGMEPF